MCGYRYCGIITSIRPTAISDTNKAVITVLNLRSVCLLYISFCAVIVRMTNKCVDNKDIGATGKVSK